MAHGLGRILKKILPIASVLLPGADLATAGILGAQRYKQNKEQMNENKRLLTQRANLEQQGISNLGVEQANQKAQLASRMGRTGIAGTPAAVGLGTQLGNEQATQMQGAQYDLLNTQRNKRQLKRQYNAGVLEDTLGAASGLINT